MTDYTKNTRQPYKADYIKNIVNNSENLRQIFFDTIRLQHAIKYSDNSHSEWKEYNPTHFMYIYFIFNSLYSIKWEDSLNSGKIKPFEAKDKSGKQIYESTKYNNLIDFCFEDPDFPKTFRSKFIEIITLNQNAKEIQKTIDSIDIVNIKKTDIETLKKTIKNLLSNKNGFKASTIKKIFRFISEIRNNIFHGTKTLDDMLRVEHQRKLFLYSHFIIAINQMLFSYLDYLHKKPHYHDYNYLIKILNTRKRNADLLNEDAKYKYDISSLDEDL